MYVNVFVNANLPPPPLLGAGRVGRAAPDKFPDSAEDKCRKLLRLENPMHICMCFAYVCHFPSTYILEAAFGRRPRPFGRPPV